MRCPTLSELPPPLPGKTGWPWTEETDLLPERMPDGAEWPRICIVTPSYNQGQFIEETIRSILLQGYPNLEYIIIDGGSRDKSVEIIRKYDQYLAYWVSEKDRGQADAINKGIVKCSGEVFNWINSDDFLTKGSLRFIAEAIVDSDVLAGAVCNFSEAEKILIRSEDLSAISIILDLPNSKFHQPGIWLKTEKLKKIGDLKEEFIYCFDWDLAIRYLSHFSKVTYISDVLVNFRIHSDAKTVINQRLIQIERERILQDLLRDHTYQNSHKYISLALRRRIWYYQVKSNLKSNQKNKYEKALYLIINSCGDPETRWSRFTLGAIRKILLYSSRLRKLV